VDTLREVRTIKEGGVYVYDIREDRNTRIIESTIENCTEITTSCNPDVLWFPDSEHVLYVKDAQIHIMEFDGTNDTVVYAGPFINGFVFPWPNGSKLVILTDLNNRSILPNLYTVSLK
jgi:Tol biopolymer transport system component